jgi:CDP-6-deoxy-D-xylo-4-hexulose-3-dehydrase
MKITDMQAACGLGQLERLEGFIEKRKKNLNFLKKKLSNLEEDFLLPEAEKNSDPSWFGFPITLKKNCKVEKVDIIKKLTEKKIGTRLLFAGNITKQPAYLNKKFKINGNLEVTDNIMNNSFWVGIHPSLGEEELNFIAKSLEECIK